PYALGRAISAVIASTAALGLTGLLPRAALFLGEEKLAEKKLLLTEVIKDMQITDGVDLLAEICQGLLNKFELQRGPKGERGEKGDPGVSNIPGPQAAKDESGERGERGAS